MVFAGFYRVFYGFCKGTPKKKNYWLLVKGKINQNLWPPRVFFLTPLLLREEMLQRGLSFCVWVLFLFDSCFFFGSVFVFFFFFFDHVVFSFFFRLCCFFVVL